MVIFPGTFDPITVGHIDILERALHLFDEVVVAVAKNDLKKPLFSLEEREQLIEQSISHLEGVSVQHYDGLLVNFAKEINAKAFIRGVRNSIDFEMECQLAYANKSINESIETLFIMPSSSHVHISSTLVKEIASHGGDVSAFVPKPVGKAFEKLKEKK